MAKSQYADIDPFSNKHDSATSIGAGIRNIDTIDPLYDPDDDDDAADIGRRVALWTELEDEEFFDSISGYDHDKVSDKIHSVTRNPATHMAIATVATQAPPVGAAVAGVAEAGILYAEAWAQFGGTAINVGKKVGDFISSPFKKKKKKGKGKKFADMTLDELEERLEAYERTARYIPSNRIFIPIIKGEIAKREDAEDTRAAKDLAATMDRARKGDTKARKKLVGIKFLTNPGIGAAIARARAIANGLDEEDAQKVAAKTKKETKRRMANVARKAAKFTKVKQRDAVKGMPNLAKVDAVMSEAEKAINDRITKASIARGPLSGIVVPVKGRKRKGKFRNKRGKGQAGFLVTSKGRAIPGVWSDA